MKPTQKLHDPGQSLWLDITRGLLNGGKLRQYRDEPFVTGLISANESFRDNRRTTDYAR